MAVFWQRWSVLVGMMVITLMMAFMQQESQCPNLYQLWNREKTEGRDPLPFFMKMAGVQPEMSTPKPTQGLDKPTAPVKKEEKAASRPRVELLEVGKLLNPNYIPNSVFYIWCGRRWLEFHHYLSIQSVIREIKPDNLIFYFDNEPIQDNWIYNTWYKELKEQYPFFRVAGNDQTWGNLCTEQGKPSLDYIHRRLKDKGGMYMSEYTLLNSYAQSWRLSSVVNTLDTKTMKGFIMAQRFVDITNALNNIDKYKVKQYQCAPNNQTFNQLTKKPICVNTDKVFFPENIWELNTDFGGLVRKIFYGTPEILRPEPSYDELIPNIAHLVWLGGGEMDFLFYLSVLSLIFVAKVDNVYIHGDGPPTGPYWERIKNHPKVNLIYRETPVTVFGTRVDVISHVTDVWRVDFMIRYGGIYMDTDTVFVKPMDREIRGYDAVGTVDWTYWNPPFPDTINFGVAIGKRNATYWHEFQKTMKWWIDADWSWNGLRQPYKIKEKRPDLMKIDPRIQVTCYKFLCHPTWVPNYHNESIHHENTPSLTDWRDVYAFHWTLPTPPELLSEQAAINGQGMFSEIAKFVLKEAGVYKKDMVFKHTKFRPYG